MKKLNRNILSHNIFYISDTVNELSLMRHVAIKSECPIYMKAINFCFRFLYTLQLHVKVAFQVLCNVKQVLCARKRNFYVRAGVLVLQSKTSFD